jgi:hypothetical protein
LPIRASRSVLDLNRRKLSGPAVHVAEWNIGDTAVSQNVIATRDGERRSRNAI